MAGAGKDLIPEHKTDKEQPPDELSNDQAGTGLKAHSTALLGVIQDIEDDDVFRLDFKLEWALGKQSPSIVKRTFVLKQTGTRLELNLTTTLLNMSYRQPDSPIQDTYVWGNILK